MFWSTKGIMLPEQKIVIMNHFHLLFVPQKLSTVWVYKGAEMTGLGLKGLGGWQGEDRGYLPVFLFILGLTPLQSRISQGPLSIYPWNTDGVQVPCYEGRGSGGLESP